MRVLFLNTERGWRGGERQTLLTMRALRDMGADIELVARARGRLAEIAYAEGFRVHTCPTFFSLLIKLFFISARFDVLHAHTALTASALAIFKVFKKQPIVFTRRTDFDSSKKAWVRRLKWKQFDRLVAISRAAAKEPIRLGLKPTLVRSAVPVVEPNPTRIHEFLDQYRLRGKTLVGTATVFTADKDPLTCISTAAKICAKHNDVIFLHWGTGGS